MQLQRIVFNFNNFKNEKVNTYFSFPEVLDLTPYSLNKVMKTEGKIKDKYFDPNYEEGSDSEEEQDDDMTEEDKQERIEEKQTYLDHIRHNANECYQYKLVGVIIHTGSANGGHYYSLVNTDRFTKTNEDEDEWLNTSKDPWMKFNDSKVSNYDYENLKTD
jgi:ubiquitin carboxyl-terminal hydrolase 34